MNIFCLVPVDATFEYISFVSSKSFSSELLDIFHLNIFHLFYLNYWTFCVDVRISIGTLFFICFKWDWCMMVLLFQTKLVAKNLISCPSADKFSYNARWVAIILLCKSVWHTNATKLDIYPHRFSYWLIYFIVKFSNFLVQVISVGFFCCFSQLLLSTLHIQHWRNFGFFEAFDFVFKIAYFYL